MSRKNKVIVIGSGFSSLSVSAYLAKAGYDVTIYEKNASLGGRANQLIKNGYTFDTGPSFYWMPDIFEDFFADFGKTSSDYYTLEKLNPAYSIYFSDKKRMDIPDTPSAIYDLFEKEEKGAGVRLKKWMKKAAKNYEIGVKEMIYKPGISPLELVNLKTITRLGRFLSNIRKDIYKNFKSAKLRQLLEFPVLFLGAKPTKTPSFYNFMNYADFELGTWYPKGGMYSVVKGLSKLAEAQGVKFVMDSPIDKILVREDKVQGVVIRDELVKADIIVSGADYVHTESLLLPKFRNYSNSYWSKKVFAPSALLFYVGFSKKIKNVTHHTLFFDTDFDSHAKKIYDTPSWHEEPLFYASFPSISEPELAPEGHDSAVFLIPIAVGLSDQDDIKQLYFDKIITRLELITKQKVKASINFVESFCTSDFINLYHSYKGNAYGLANTLFQTAFLRPKLKSKKVKNLYYTGQLTVPGPGVPPALVSGKIVSNLINR